MKITQKDIDDKGGKIFTTKSINEIIEKSNLGLPLKRDERIWFNNIPGVRKSSMNFAMTNDEVDEYIKCKMSVHYFAEHYCWIKREDGTVGPIFLRDYQKKMLDLFDQNKYSILNCSRQSGKTIVTSIYILWFSLFHEDKSSMIVANRGDTVKEITDKIQKIYINLPFFLKRGCLNWNQTAITFENGSRVKTSRRTKDPAVGYSIDLLYLDEFAKIPDSIIRPYYTAAVPTVSSIENSKIIVSSTPEGFNFFYELIRDAKRDHDDPDWNQFHCMEVYWWAIKGRRDTKLIPLKNKLKKYEIEFEDVITFLKDLNYEFYQKKENNIIYNKIKWYEEFEETHIEQIRKTIYIKDENTHIPLIELCTVVNWQEEQTTLIGGKDNFSQEFDLQFITGNKLLLDNIQLEKLISSQVEFKHHSIPSFDKKLVFSYENLKFIDDPSLFEIDKVKGYHIIAGVDLSEGLGQDYSVINIFRLIPKDKDTITRFRHTYQNIYDFFKLEQIGIFRSNVHSTGELAQIFYMIFFELFDPEKVKVAVEYNTYGASLLTHLPNIFNGINNYSNSIFFRYKHKAEDKIPKIGLRITGGTEGKNSKKLLIKEFQIAIRKGNLIIHEGISVSELGVFSKKETPGGDTTYQSETGNDDTVMSIVQVSSIFNLPAYKDYVDTYIQHVLDNDYRNILDEFNNQINDGSVVNLNVFKTGYSQIYKRGAGAPPNPFNKNLPLISRNPFGNY